MLSHPAYAVADPCENAKNTADEIACAQQKYDGASAALNESYDAILLEKDSDTGAAFRADQQRWVAYRDTKCAWESHETDEEGLQRLRELECRYKETQNRLDTFADKKEALAIKQPLLTTPRWLNHLSTKDADVYWAYGSRVEGDFNCDGTPDYMIKGLRIGADKTPIGVIAVTEDTQGGLPRNWIFDLDAACAHDWDHALGEAKDEVCPTLTIENPSCTAQIIIWDEENYTLTPVTVEMAAEQKEEQE